MLCLRSLVTTTSGRLHLERPHASAGSLAACEEQQYTLSALVTQDAAAQRDFLLDDFGSDSLLDDERRQRAVWMAKCQASPRFDSERMMR